MNSFTRYDEPSLWQQETPDSSTLDNHRYSQYSESMVLDGVNTSNISCNSQSTRVTAQGNPAGVYVMDINGNWNANCVPQGPHSSEGRSHLEPSQCSEQMAGPVCNLRSTHDGSFGCNLVSSSNDVTANFLQSSGYSIEQTMQDTQTDTRSRPTSGGISEETHNILSLDDNDLEQNPTLNVALNTPEIWNILETFDSPKKEESNGSSQYQTKNSKSVKVLRYEAEASYKNENVQGYSDQIVNRNMDEPRNRRSAKTVKRVRKTRYKKVAQTSTAKTRELIMQQQQLCSCLVNEGREAVPIAQVFVRDGQMYRLPEANVIRLGDFEFYAFIKGNDCFISLALFFKAIGCSAQRLFEREMMAKLGNLQLKEMGDNEMELLRQKSHLNSQTKTKDLINVADLVTLSRCIQAEQPSNKVVNMIAKGFVFQKVLETSPLKCSVCGLYCKAVSDSEEFVPLELLFSVAEDNVINRVEDFTNSDDVITNSDDVITNRVDVISSRGDVITNRVDVITNSDVSDEQPDGRLVINDTDFNVLTEDEDVCIADYTLGILKVDNVNFTSFRLEDKSYLCFKEIIRLKLVTLSNLQIKMSALHFIPVVLPDEVEGHISLHWPHAGSTLWMDTTQLRCCLCMGRTSKSVASRNLIKDICCGEYEFTPKLTVFCKKLETDVDFYHVVDPKKFERVTTLNGYQVKKEGKNTFQIAELILNRENEHSESVPVKTKSRRKTYLPKKKRSALKTASSSPDTTTDINVAVDLFDATEVTSACHNLFSQATNAEQSSAEVTSCDQSVALPKEDGRSSSPTQRPDKVINTENEDLLAGVILETVTGGTESYLTKDQLVSPEHCVAPNVVENEISVCTEIITYEDQVGQVSASVVGPVKRTEEDEAFEAKVMLGPGRYVVMDRDEFRKQFTEGDVQVKVITSDDGVLESVHSCGISGLSVKDITFDEGVHEPVDLCGLTGTTVAVFTSDEGCIEPVDSCGSAVSSVNVITSDKGPIEPVESCGLTGSNVQVTSEKVFLESVDYCGFARSNDPAKTQESTDQQRALMYAPNAEQSDTKATECNIPDSKSNNPAKPQKLTDQPSAHIYAFEESGDAVKNADIEATHSPDRDISSAGIELPTEHSPSSDTCVEEHISHTDEIDIGEQTLILKPGKYIVSDNKLFCNLVQRGAVTLENDSVCHFDMGDDYEEDTDDTPVRDGGSQINEEERREQRDIGGDSITSIVSVELNNKSVLMEQQTQTLGSKDKKADMKEDNHTRVDTSAEVYCEKRDNSRELGGDKVVEQVEDEMMNEQESQPLVGTDISASKAATEEYDKTVDSANNSISDTGNKEGYYCDKTDSSARNKIPDKIDKTDITVSNNIPDKSDKTASSARNKIPDQSDKTDNSARNTNLDKSGKKDNSESNNISHKSDKTENEKSEKILNPVSDYHNLSNNNSHSCIQDIEQELDEFSTSRHVTVHVSSCGNDVQTSYVSYGEDTSSVSVKNQMSEVDVEHIDSQEPECVSKVTNVSEEENVGDPDSEYEKSINEKGDARSPLNMRTTHSLFPHPITSTPNTARKSCSSSRVDRWYTKMAPLNNSNSPDVSLQMLATIATAETEPDSSVESDAEGQADWSPRVDDISGNNQVRENQSSKAAGLQFSLTEETMKALEAEKDALEVNMKKFLVFSVTKGNPLTFSVQRFKPGAEEVFPVLFHPDPSHPRVVAKRKRFMDAAAKYLQNKYYQHMREQNSSDCQESRQKETLNRNISRKIHSVDGSSGTARHSARMIKEAVRETGKDEGKGVPTTEKRLKDKSNVTDAFQSTSSRETGRSETPMKVIRYPNLKALLIRRMSDKKTTSPAKRTARDIAAATRKKMKEKYGKISDVDKTNEKAPISTERPDNTEVDHETEKVNNVDTRKSDTKMTPEKGGIRRLRSKSPSKASRLKLSDSTSSIEKTPEIENEHVHVVEVIEKFENKNVDSVVIENTQQKLKASMKRKMSDQNSAPAKKTAMKIVEESRKIKRAKYDQISEVGKTNEKSTKSTERPDNRAVDHDTEKVKEVDIRNSETKILPEEGEIQKLSSRSSSSEIKITPEKGGIRELRSLSPSSEIKIASEKVGIQKMRSRSSSSEIKITPEKGGIRKMRSRSPSKASRSQPSNSTSSVEKTPETENKHVHVIAVTEESEKEKAYSVASGNTEDSNSSGKKSCKLKSNAKSRESIDSEKEKVGSVGSGKTGCFHKSRDKTGRFISGDNSKRKESTDSQQEKIVFSASGNTDNAHPSRKKSPRLKLDEKSKSKENIDAEKVKVDSVGRRKTSNSPSSRKQSPRLNSELNSDKKSSSRGSLDSQMEKVGSGASGNTGYSRTLTTVSQSGKISKCSESTDVDKNVKTTNLDSLKDLKVAQVCLKKLKFLDDAVRSYYKTSFSSEQNEGQSKCDIEKIQKDHTVAETNRGKRKATDTGERKLRKKGKCA